MTNKKEKLKTLIRHRGHCYNIKGLRCKNCPLYFPLKDYPKDIGCMVGEEIDVADIFKERTKIAKEILESLKKLEYLKRLK